MKTFMLHAQYFNKKGSVRQRVKKIHIEAFCFLCMTHTNNAVCLVTLQVIVWIQN